MAASPLCENVTPLENLESAEDGFIPNPGIDTLLYTDFFSPDLWLPYGNQVGNDIFRTQSPESTLQDGASEIRRFRHLSLIASRSQAARVAPFRVQFDVQFAGPLG